MSLAAMAIVTVLSSCVDRVSSRYLDCLVCHRQRQSCHDNVFPGSFKGVTYVTACSFCGLVQWDQSHVAMHSFCQMSVESVFFSNDTSCDLMTLYVVVLSVLSCVLILSVVVLVALSSFDYWRVNRSTLCVPCFSRFNYWVLNVVNVFSVL
jgi:hypothetical protein